jgi:hypothetical protein
MALTYSEVRAEIDKSRAVNRPPEFRGADLRGRSFSYDDLRGADFFGANLSGCNFHGADLTGANLSRVVAVRACFHGANLTGVSLKRAVTVKCDFGRADLTGATFDEDSVFAGSDFRGAKNADHVAGLTLLTPEGDVIGWKKCQDGKIVKLRIPAKAARGNAGTRKCRAASAKVLAVYTKSGRPSKSAVSIHDEDFVYRVGATVKPTGPFDANRWDECSSGIHFFLTRAEAEAYIL